MTTWAAALATERGVERLRPIMSMRCTCSLVEARLAHHARSRVALAARTSSRAPGCCRLNRTMMRYFCRLTRSPPTLALHVGLAAGWTLLIASAGSAQGETAGLIPALRSAIALPSIAPAAEDDHGMAPGAVEAPVALRFNGSHLAGILYQTHCQGDRSHATRTSEPGGTRATHSWVWAVEPEPASHQCRGRPAHVALTAKIQRNQIANHGGGNRQNPADSDCHRQESLI